MLHKVKLFGNTECLLELSYYSDLQILAHIKPLLVQNHIPVEVALSLRFTIKKRGGEHS
jgi:hypothetical protein